MTLEPSVLADGQLGASEATLYTVPANCTAYIKTIALSNRGAAANVVQLYIQHDGGASRRVYYKSLAATDTERVTDPITLEAGDLLRGEAGTAAEVDYAVFGAWDVANYTPPASSGFDIGWDIEELDAGLTVTAFDAPV
jgi:hypothetical protein